MESIWGTDCLELFQAGPRICLGKEMAFIQMKSITASVLREFKFKVDPDFKPKFVDTLTAKMEIGLPVRVEKREHLKGV
ncbi:hypothetical protein SUGI_0632800 [Cryptomeria japonica]|nr:hypothetical protein SUGI_0632800 [Cryptomeria japonica]